MFKASVADISPPSHDVQGMMTSIVKELVQNLTVSVEKQVQDLYRVPASSDPSDDVIKDLSSSSFLHSSTTKTLQCRLWNHSKNLIFGQDMAVVMCGSISLSWEPKNPKIYISAWISRFDTSKCSSGRTIMISKLKQSGLGHFGFWKIPRSGLKMPGCTPCHPQKF
jgi:hypothetical protein